MGRSLSRNTAADSNGVNAHDGALAGDAGEILVPADTRDAGQANAWYPPALEPQDHRQPVWLPERPAGRRLRASALRWLSIIGAMAGCI